MQNFNAIRQKILTATGFSSLNGMQEKMLTVTDNRIILLSPTGSGKTIAFILRLLKSLDTPGKGTQALILAPSRELALQIAEVLKKSASGYRTLPLYGGHSMRDEANSIAASSPDIIVATPGRLLDHMGQHTLNLRNVKSLIIDEYDKCLELGFMDEMKKILRKIPRPELTILTSATPIDKVPEEINLDGASTFDFRMSGTSSTPNIEIIEVPSPIPDKLPILVDLLHSFSSDSKVIVFSNHRESAERIHDGLRKAGIPAGIYHGGMEQQDRQLAVMMLRNGTTPVLSATDLAARGLDIPDLDAVIHYHIPPSSEAWTHRNGRTARAGASGKVYTILSEKDNRPEFIDADRTWSPTDNPSKENDPIQLPVTLLINLGKRDKISRGDILGYLTKQVGIDGKEVGRIDLDDRFAAVALTPAAAKAICESSQPQKIKGHRFRPEILS